MGKPQGQVHLISQPDPVFSQAALCVNAVEHTAADAALVAAKVAFADMGAADADVLVARSY